MAILGLTGCQADSPFGDDQDPPTTLVASPVYSEGNDAAQAQLETLQRAIDSLRAATGSGWTGRQDDVTGYLADLSGGRFTTNSSAGVDGLIESFFDSHGLDLFGVTYDVLAVADFVPPDEMGPAAVRATQEIDGIPVLDGQLTVGLSDPREGAAITGIRGRVFAGLSPSTDPSMPAKSAVRTAERVSDGERTGRPSLVIVPNGTGLLAWEVTITGAEGSGISLGDGAYYLDAITGDLIEVRPLGAEANPTMLNPVNLGKSAGAAVRVAAEGDAVEIRGAGPSGEQITSVGRQTANGVELVDTTTPTYDPATGKGGIYTYSAQDTRRTSRASSTSSGRRTAPPSAIPMRWPRTPTAGRSTTTTPAWAGTHGTAPAPRSSRASTTATTSSATPTSPTASTRRRWSTATPAAGRAAWRRW